MRLPDWDVRLIKYIDSMADQPFEWAKHDCTRFASGAVEAMTGINYMEEFVGEYEDKITAARALREMGQGTLYKTIVAKVGGIVAHGRRGDAAFTYFPDGNAVGICLGQNSVFVGEKGLITVPSSECGFFRIE